MESLEERVVLAASPTLIDLNPMGPSDPTDFTQVGDMTFFVANDGTLGRELWKTDGTVQGTSMVADISEGGASSLPTDLVEMGGLLYFSATDGENGRELWRSDGTTAGTLMVKDLFPGTYTVSYQTFFNSSNPTQLTNVNGTLFFSAKDGEHGTELWKSDGTEAGTMLVLDIAEGTVGSTAAPRSSNPQALTNVNGVLYFSANDGEHGQELWQSDGTEQGTLLIKDIFTGTYPYYYDDTYVGEYPNGSNPGLMTVANGTLYFVAVDEDHGAELWQSDGTEAGTVLVKDIHEDTEDAFTDRSMMVELDGMLLFTANDGEHGDELWRSDGTEEGTVLVKDIQPGSEGNLSYYGGLTVIDGALYFAADDGVVGRELWRSDGTEEGTLMVADIRPGSYDDGLPRSGFPFFMESVGGVLYFSAFSDSGGRELWQSDGTAAGTEPVADVVPGAGDFQPESLNEIAGRLFFSGIAGTARELFMLIPSESFHLSIFVDGTESEIPANVGLRADGTTADGYTVADDGQIFVDLDGGFALSDFFSTWRMDAGLAGNNPDAFLNSEQVLGNFADTTHTIQVFVNGNLVKDFEDYAIQGDEQITVVYGSNPVVSLQTNFGSILVELFEDVTPGTVDNFLNYINDSDYVNSFFHRSAENFVIQAGGFRTSSTTFTGVSQFSPVPTDAQIMNEPGISNLRGTIAMAKQSGNPNSATSQFFFNLGDNSDLDLPENNSFTVFGRALSMTTVDTIANLPIDNSNPTPYGELPLSFDDQLAVISSIEGQGELSGVRFVDLDGNGVRDTGEAGISGAVVYIDANDNGQFDAGEGSTMTDAEGRYLFQLEPGMYTVRAVVSVGGLQTVPAPGEGYDVVVEIGREVENLDFGEESIPVPAEVDLVAGSDTGRSDEDNITQNNNSATANTLEFTVSGVNAGAEVRLYAAGTLIGSAVATGSSVTITTDGSTALADGIHDITATQVLDGVESDENDALQIAIDTTAPAPITTTPPETTPLDATFQYDAHSDDEGELGVEYLLVNAPPGMTIDAQTGLIEWTPLVDQAVPQEFTIELRDIAGNATSQDVELTVLKDVAVFPDHYAVDEDGQLTVNAAEGVLANDGDDESGELIAMRIESTAHGTLMLISNGSFTYVPDADFFGEDSFTYIAFDATEPGNIAKVTITVNAVQDAPVPAVDAYELDEDMVLTVDSANGVLANDVDVDGDDLSAILEAGPTMGTLELNSDGSFTYTPDAEAFGADSFAYRVSDGTTTSDPISVSLSVQEVNDTPTAVDDEYQVDEDGSLTVDVAEGVLANDTDPDTSVLTAMIESEPTSGTLTFNEDGSFNYSPDADFFGTDSFTYVTSDGASDSEVATVTITVNPQADPPTANDDELTVNNVTTVQMLDVLANDSTEPDGDQELLIITATQGSAGGMVRSPSGSMIEYTAPAGFLGTETFTYTVEDADGLTSTATVAVTVVDSGRSVISGFVYMDANNDGVRDAEEQGVPGALVTLTGTSSMDDDVTLTALTADDGSYSFEDIAAGNYQLTETQPAALTDGTDVTTITGATLENDEILDIVLAGTNEFTENNFGERGLQPQYMTIVWFFASSQSHENFFREMMARGEELAGNDDLADAIRAGDTTLDEPVDNASSLVADDQSAQDASPSESGTAANLALAMSSDVGSGDFDDMPLNVFDDANDEEAAEEALAGSVVDEALADDDDWLVL